MQELVHQHLLHAQARMKHQANKHRSERSFAMQDWVNFKLQPYVQSSVMPRAHHKLCFRYFNPYQIIDRVGQVAYHLAVPASSRIHLVVLVSQLRLGKVVDAYATMISLCLIRSCCSTMISLIGVRVGLC
jgi:hypothetical protein